MRRTPDAVGTEYSGFRPRHMSLGHTRSARRLRELLLGGTALVAVSGCAPARQPEPPPTTVSAQSDEDTAAAAPPVRSQSSPSATCDDEFPPLDLVGANIAITDASGIAEVISGRVTGPDGTVPPPDEGYVVVEYRVRLLKALSHRKAAAEFIVTQTAEAPTQAHAPGSLLLYSGCIDDAGVYEPDVAYFIWLGAGCRQRLEAFARRALHTPAPGGEWRCSGD